MKDPQAAFVRADLLVIRAVYPDDGEIARTLGVDPDHLERWAHGNLPDKTLRERLHEFAVAVRGLCEHYHPQAVPDWFDADHVDVGRPADMLQAGGYAALHAEVADAVAMGYS
jgi:hypothetical protein